MLIQKLRNNRIELFLLVDTFIKLIVNHGSIVYDTLVLLPYISPAAIEAAISTTRLYYTHYRLS